MKRTESAARIATVTMNAAIDKTYYLPKLEIGRAMRVTSALVDAGGKGINVARVLRQLGLDVTATGFVGGYNGAYIERELQSTGIEPDFVRVAGESRLALNFIDESTGQSTEFIEPGPAIGESAVMELRDKVRAAARRSALVCFSGSMPAGVPADLYRELIGIARHEGATVLLDASGEPLRHGVRAAPDVIKPNEEEAAQLFGVRTGREDEMRRAMARLAEEYGIPCVCVSLGARGSLALAGGRFYRLRLPEQKVVNAVGSGDAYLAGLAAGMARGWPLRDSLRLAAAAGTANALHRRAGYVEPDVVARLFELVELSEEEA